VRLNLVPVAYKGQKMLVKIGNVLDTKCFCVVTRTNLNITEQEIVDVKRNFRLHPHYTIDQRSFDVKKLI